MDFVFQRSYRGPLQAVIFDWAGTISDYGCFAPAVVFVDLFKQRGIEISMEQARGPMGMAKRDHVAAIARMPGVAAQWRNKYGGECGESDIDSMYAAFIPMQLACLADYSELIPGTLEAVRDCRARGLKIGTSTGYNGEMLAICMREGKRQGFEADNNVSNSDVPQGRPAPWMCLENAKHLGVYPMEAAVKVGDTVPDIGEGLNAGMWTVGTSLSGNEMGMTRSEVTWLAENERNARRAKIAEKMRMAGAHYVIDSVAELPTVLDDIAKRVQRGERP